MPSPPFHDFARSIQPQTPLRDAITAACASARNRVRAAPVGPGQLAASSDDARPRIGDPTGRGAAGQDAGGRRRRADPRICALEPGGRGADVPGRGAAAHSRRRDARRADPRQDRRRRLARPSRPQPVIVRQRRDLGPAADRAADRDQQRAQPVGRADAPDRTRRRAADPHRRQSRHAPDGRAVRRRPDHRRGAVERPRPGGDRASAIPTTCWARRRSRRRRLITTCRPTGGRSMPSAAPPGAAASTKGRASRSSSRRCIRATAAPRASACRPSSIRG